MIGCKEFIVSSAGISAVIGCGSVQETLTGRPGSLRLPPTVAVTAAAQSRTRRGVSHSEATPPRPEQQTDGREGKRGTYPQRVVVVEGVQ